MSQLHHPNIVQTFDFGQCRTRRSTSSWSTSRARTSARVLSREGPLPSRARPSSSSRSARRSTEAHEAGIIHRDLKPENLMIIRRRDGTEHAKVLDFGLAKLRERDESAAITTGEVLGTPYYMSPEQVRAETLDPRADVYSLGATLYRVLSGPPPFQAPSPVAVLSKHLTDQVVPPGRRVPERGLPPEADAHRDARHGEDRRGDRYPSAAKSRPTSKRRSAVVPRTESPPRGVEAAARAALDGASPEVTDSPTISIVSEGSG